MSRNLEISEIVKRCRVLLLDIEGTTTSIGFVKAELFPYAKEKVTGFLERHWEDKDLKDTVAALRKQNTEDKEAQIEGLVLIPGEDASKDEQIEGLVKNVNWQMSIDRKAGPLKQLQGDIWKEGYNNGDIKGHVFDDVAPTITQWRAAQDKRVFIYSSGSVPAQQFLFRNSLVGDMTPLIDGYFDTAVGMKQESSSYATITVRVGCRPDEILFITDTVKEAEAARSSGLQVALMCREGNEPLPATATAAFPVLHSFEQLSLTNKRKPDPQVEEVPAKVPKTDTKDDVKTTPEMDAVKANGFTEALIATAAIEKATEEPEMMEVEETPGTTAAETKVKETSCTETTSAESVCPKTAAVDTKVDSTLHPATAVSDITENDVPMKDSVTNVPTEVKASVDAAIVKAVSMEKLVEKVDTTEIASNEKSVTDKDIALGASSTTTKVEEVLTAEIAKPESSTAEVTVEAKSPEPKVEVVVAEPVCLVETKTKMVDAATLTENDAIAEASKFVQEPAVVLKTVDVATETVSMEVLAEEVSKIKEAPKMEMKSVETPIEGLKGQAGPVSEPTSIVIPTNDAKDASSTEPKEKSLSTATAIKSNNTEAPKIEDAVIEDSKTEEVIATVEMKPEDSTTVNTSECVSNGTKADSLNGSNSIAPSAQVDDASAKAETEPKINEEIQAKDKSEEMPEDAVITDQKGIAEPPAIVVEPVIEEIGKKTEPNETEKMESEVTVNEEEVETATEPMESTENPLLEANMDASPPSIEIKDITDDKQSLSETTDIIDDVVPIVEEPSSNLEEMEELQNAGDVLEKECDEILSKVQDVTNIDYIPVKPLHTIAEEEMETDNIDSIDLVNRILDTEMELSIKSEEIDINAVPEITEPKVDTDEKMEEVEPVTEKPCKEVGTEVKVEKSDVDMVAEKSNEDKLQPDAKSETKEATLEPTEEKMETEEAPEAKLESGNNVQSENKVDAEESKKDTEIVIEPAAQAGGTEQKTENSESDKTVAVAQESKEDDGTQTAKIDNPVETKVNGKTNGNEIVKLNGDSSQDDGLKARLTAENDKEKVNGSNGNSVSAEVGQADKKVEAEIPDIKVRMAGTDEAPLPKEQPVDV